MDFERCTEATPEHLTDSVFLLHRQDWLGADPVDLSD